MIPFIHIGQTCSFRYWLSCILQWDEPRSEGNVDGLHSKKRLIAPFLQGKRTCQCTQLLQFSVCTEGEGGSAEPLLPLHSRVGARLLHPHQLSRRRRFLTGALQKRESQRKGSHYCKKGQGQGAPAPEETARQSLCSRAQESVWSQREDRRGDEERWGKERQGKARRRGVERRGEDKRGSSSLPNQIGWFSAKQPDHGQRCTVQHPLTEFWDGPRGGQNNWADGADKAVNGNKQQDQQSVNQVWSNTRRCWIQVRQGTDKHSGLQRLCFFLFF